VPKCLAHRLLIEGRLWTVASSRGACQAPLGRRRLADQDGAVLKMDTERDEDRAFKVVEAHRSVVEVDGQATWMALSWPEERAPRP